MSKPFADVVARAWARLDSPSTPSTRQQPWSKTVADAEMHSMFERLCAVYRSEDIFANANLIKAEHEIDANYLAKDLAGLRGALDTYERVARMLIADVNTVNSVNTPPAATGPPVTDASRNPTVDRRVGASRVHPCRRTDEGTG
jgi:hypothetical protein